jgi:hypothetical protein
MQKKWITCVTVVLALTFPCWGVVVSNQGFGINSDNGTGIVGAGVATSSNLLAVNDLQQNSDKTGLIRTVQAELGVLGQGAAAGAIDGFFGVTQQGTVNGAQTQMHPGGGMGGASLGTQFQGLGVDLGQQVNAAQGSHGMAVGLQVMSGVQVQLIATPWGVNLNIQPVMASVYDAVGL